MVLIGTHAFCYSQEKTARTPDSLYHIVMYGQSLMLGTTSVPVISNHQRYHTLMFKGGIRSGYDMEDSTYYDAFVPLVEKEVKSKSTGARMGETPASGFSEVMIDLLTRENRRVFDTISKSGYSKIRLLISAPAQGSTSVKDLIAGQYWERFKTDITKAKQLASKAGMVYNVPVILWNQGERDIDEKTPPEEYKTLMRELQHKAGLFIKSVTHQKNTVRVILYQTSSHNVRKTINYPDIANAQYELAKAEPYITMSAPTYFLPYSPDNVHLTNTGSKWNGAIHAIAAKRIIFDQKDWRPVFVKSTSFKGKNIELKFQVPHPPLMFDTVAVSNPGNFGFRVFSNIGIEIKITGVQIVKNAVRIKTIQAVTHGCIVWYGNNGNSTGAQNGARGNLRDSQGKLYQINISGDEKRLDNWSPVFKEVL